MQNSEWHLAVVNLAKPKHALDSPEIAEFMDNLDRINKIGDNSPGAVWRYEDETGAATETRVFDDPDILINFTLWESVQAIKEYAYSGDHLDFFKRRALWFAPLEELPVVTMWWVPAGTIPSLDEAKRRVEHLADHGSTIEAFTFAKKFDPPTVGAANE